MGVQVYAIGGTATVGPPVLSGYGVPFQVIGAIQGQQYYDKSTSPPTGYLFNGQTWALNPSGGSFATLNVIGNATVGGTLGVTGATTLSSTLGVTGATTLTGGVTIGAPGIVVAPTDVGPGASPQVANNRFGKVTFSGVSIAAAATQTFVITNSTITGASTDIIYSMVGATAGAALSIVSVTNSTGSSSIVVTNGTGATTSTANITFTFWVLD